MAIPVYLWLQKEAGDDIRGSVTVHEREGSVELLSLDHKVSMPADMNTGKLTGTRVHAPFTFTKEIDAASVYLYKALTKGETFKNAEFRWYRIADSGQEILYYSVLLRKVKVVHIVSKMHDIKDPTKEKHNHLEEVQLCYEEIVWVLHDGNITHMDSWNGRETG